MTGFVLWTSGVGSNRSTNWATATTNDRLLLVMFKFVVWSISSVCTENDHHSEKDHCMVSSLMKLELTKDETIMVFVWSGAVESNLFKPETELIL